MSYFEYNGKKSSDFGIRIYNTLKFQGQSRNIENIEILGKDGGLLVEKGNLSIFKKTIAFDVNIDGEFNADDGSGQFDRALEITKWLGVKGWHTFKYSMYPDYEFKATIIDEYNLEDTIRNLGKGVIEVTFYPIMYKAGQSIKTITSGQNLINTGSINSKPLIKITSSATSVIVQNNGKDWIRLQNLEGAITIDSESLEVYDQFGSATDKMILLRPLFPELSVGDNVITFDDSKISKFEINERIGEIAI